jgi:hypothetical protein
MWMRLKQLFLGDRDKIAGTVYGTIIVMSVLAAGARAGRGQLWRLLLLVAVSVIVLWLAHVYAHGLGESLKLERRLSAAELVSIARREYSIVAAAVLPLLAVGLGVAGVLSDRSSVQVALWIGVAALGAQGFRYAKLENLSPTWAVITVSLNLAVGLGLVALEVLIAH